MTTSEQSRCGWALEEPLRSYHDTEWGVPVHDDRTHFELLTLEGAQAGLSWVTVLRRREHYRRAFADFAPEEVARYSPAKIDELMANSGVIRHRAKLESTITNARAFLVLAEEFGTFDAFVWDFVGGAPILNSFTSLGEVPATTPLSVELSKELRRRGFSFMGPTSAYSYLQAGGLVMDHLTSCFRSKDLG